MTQNSRKCLVSQRRSRGCGRCHRSGRGRECRLPYTIGAGLLPHEAHYERPERRTITRSCERKRYKVARYEYEQERETNDISARPMMSITDASPLKNKLDNETLNLYHLFMLN